MPTGVQTEALDRLTGGATRVVLAGGRILSMDPGIGQLSGDILLDGDRIAEIGPGLAQRVADAVVVDASDCIVMPGMVDSHVHAWEGQLRGLSPNADFESYLSLAHGQLGPQYTPEDLNIAERLTAAQAVNGGITTIIDNCHNCRTPEHADAAVEALFASGIRAVFAAAAPLMGEHAKAMPDDLLRLRDRYFTSTDQRVQLRMFDITPSVDTWVFAQRHDFAVVAEMGPWVTNLDELIASGTMSARHTYNHCVGLPEAMWRAIADAGANVNVVPRSEPQFGLAEAFPAIVDSVRHGVLPGLSSDNELAYGLDLFAEMRVLLAQQRGRAFALAHQGDADAPRPFVPRDVLTIATAGGARNAGLAGQIGTIAVGKKADIALVRTDRLHTRLVDSPVGAVVNYANLADVDAVFIDGRPVKWGGELVGVDVAALTADAERSRERLLARAGLRADTLDDSLTGRVEDGANSEVDTLLASTGNK